MIHLSKGYVKGVCTSAAELHTLDCVYDYIDYANCWMVLFFCCFLYTIDVDVYADTGTYNAHTKDKTKKDTLQGWKVGCMSNAVFMDKPPRAQMT